MSEPSDECRREFEMWATGYGVAPEWDSEHGIYSQQLTQFMWRAWQAAWNRPRESTEN